MNIITAIAVILVAIILAVIIYTLLTINRKLKERIQKEKSRLVDYKTQIEKLKKEINDRKDIDLLNKIARDFFKERYGLKYSLTYLELAKKFRRQDKEKAAQFCDTMNILIYSGRTINQEDMNKAVEVFSDLINNQDIIST